MNRREFSTLLAAAGVGATKLSASSPSKPDISRPDVEPELLHLGHNGWMPNNTQLPVLLYRNAFPPSGDVASAMEAAFTRNGWPPQWRNGVYDFHHFHSTAHEVLGFAGGWGRILLGGEGGHELTVRTGDVAVQPAGTGHCRLEAGPGFLVIGAYPPGETWDICRNGPDAAMLARMQRVRFPASDPVTGPEGALPKHWRTA